MPAANDRVEEALRRLLAVRVDRFVVFPAEARGARVQVVTGTGTVSVTLAGMSCGEGAVAVARKAFAESDGACLPADTFAALWPALAAAADPDLRLLSQPPEGVTRIELVDGARRLVLEKQRGWRFVTPAVAYQPDPAVIADFLASLHRTQRSASDAGAKARQLRVAGRLPNRSRSRSPEKLTRCSSPDPLRFRDRPCSRSPISTSAASGARSPASPPSRPLRPTATYGSRKTSTAPTPPASPPPSAISARSLSPRSRPPEAQVTLAVDIQPPGDPKPTRHTLAVFAGCFAQLDDNLTFTIASAPCDELRLPLTSP